jgi:hypothetical protein
MCQSSALGQWHGTVDRTATFFNPLLIGTALIGGTSNQWQGYQTL